MFLLLVDEQQQQQGYENYNGIKRRQFLMIKKNHNVVLYGCAMVEVKFKKISLFLSDKYVHVSFQSIS